MGMNYTASNAPPREMPDLRRCAPLLEREAIASAAAPAQQEPVSAA